MFFICTCNCLVIYLTLFNRFKVIRYLNVFRGDGSNVQQKQAPLLFDALVKVSNNQDLSKDVRAMAFIVLGKLSKKFPELFHSKIDFLQNVFELLLKVIKFFNRVN